MPAAPPDRHASAGAPALHVQSLGAPGGAPVLALHGVTGHGRRLAPLAAAAFPERRTLAPDLRGHGRSTWEPPFTVARHVADLLGLLDAHGVARADLVAHSFGGLIALALAAAAPERAGRIALIDPALALSPARARREATRAARDASWATPEGARAALSAPFAGVAHRAAKADVVEHIARGPDGRWRERYHRAAIVTAWGEMTRAVPRLAADAGPVLVLRARDADVVGEPLRDGLRRAGVAWEEREVAGGHRLYWDALPETAAHLRTFLTPRG